MNISRFLSFVAKVMAAQVTVYFLAGAVFYPLLTKPYYEGPNAIFAVFLRTEADLGMWAHVVNWFLPVEILRGVLIAAVLYPLCDVLKAWTFAKRFLYLAALYLVLGFWAAAAAAPGTLEGMVYMRPFITPAVHLRVQPEIVLQGVAMALFVAGTLIGQRSQEREPNP